MLNAFSASKSVPPTNSVQRAAPKSAQRRNRVPRRNWYLWRTEALRANEDSGAVRELVLRRLVHFVVVGVPVQVRTIVELADVPPLFAFSWNSCCLTREL